MAQPQAAAYQVGCNLAAMQVRHLHVRARNTSFTFRILQCARSAQSAMTDRSPVTRGHHVGRGDDEAVRWVQPGARGASVRSHAETGPGAVEDNDLDGHRRSRAIERARTRANAVGRVDSEYGLTSCMCRSTLIAVGYNWR